MKTNLVSIIRLTLIVFILFPITFSCGVSSKSMIPKMQTDFNKEAEKMRSKGALAVVGIAVAPADRHDLGRSKAKSEGYKTISEEKRAYVENTMHDFREEVGADRNAELNDVFNQVTDVISANIIKGARIVEFDAYQTKGNKEEGTYTYLVILAITPEFTYQSLLDEFKQTKGSEENLYQRYVDSQAKKEHERKIKVFKEEFGVDDD